MTAYQDAISFEAADIDDDALKTTFAAPGVASTYTVWNGVAGNRPLAFGRAVIITGLAGGTYSQQPFVVRGETADAQIAEEELAFETPAGGAIETRRGWLQILSIVSPGHTSGNLRFGLAGAEINGKAFMTGADGMVECFTVGGARRIYAPKGVLIEVPIRRLQADNTTWPVTIFF